MGKPSRAIEELVKANKRKLKPNYRATSSDGETYDFRVQTDGLARWIANSHFKGKLDRLEKIGPRGGLREIKKED